MCKSGLFGNPKPQTHPKTLNPKPIEGSWRVPWVYGSHRVLRDLGFEYGVLAVLGLLGFRVQGLGLLGFRVQGLGLLGFRV